MSQLNTRIPKSTEEQIKYLLHETGMTQTQIVIVAIDRYTQSVKAEKEKKQMVDYDPEEQWNVQGAMQSLRESGAELTNENINAWLEEHRGEEHAYGAYGPVSEEKIEAIIADLQERV